MTLHDRLPIAHGVYQYTRGSSIRHTYWARCSCGWEGPERRTARAATEDIDDHQETEKH